MDSTIDISANAPHFLPRNASSRKQRHSLALLAVSPTRALIRALRRAIYIAGSCLKSTERGIAGVAYGYTAACQVPRASRAHRRHSSTRTSALDNVKSAIVCSTLSINPRPSVHNGTRRSLWDGSRLCGRGAREVLLARLATQHMDHCHAGDGGHDLGCERAVHANTRPDGAGYAMVRTHSCDQCFTVVIYTVEPQFEKHKLMSRQDHALRRHGRRARPRIYHH